MSNPSETSGRPLSSQLPHQQEQHPTQQSSAPLNKRRRSSQSSDDRVGGTKSPSSRRRPSARNEASFRPHAGTSRGDSSTMQHQRSTSPGQMSPEGQQQVNYTRTGRISKAKKGLKVHNCEACGKVSLYLLFFPSFFQLYFLGRNEHDSGANVRHHHRSFQLRLHIIRCSAH